MLEHYPLKTYQYLCDRLGDVTPVHTELAYYTDNGDAYPLNAEIPFAHQSYRLSCPNTLKCGVSWVNADGVLQEAWHLCPALATLRERQTLPEPHRHDSPDIPADDAQEIVGPERLVMMRPSDLDDSMKRDEELSSGKMRGRTPEEVMQAARRALG